MDFTPASTSSAADEPVGQRVLVVDDDQSIHELVRKRLRDQSVEIDSAHNGREAFIRIGFTKPDLILLDIDMPGMSGFDVCRQLKASVETVNIPVIFLTGSDGMEDKVAGLELGAVDYVTKPFNPVELKARVRAALRTKFAIDLLAQRALIDALTGLWNRGYLDQSLTKHVAQASRSGTPLSLILCDVDHFKTVNDRFGHPIGDDVLRAVGRTLMKRTRASDTVCRYGGEEFAVLTPDTPATAAANLAEDMRHTIEQLLPIATRPDLRITASLGVAELVGAGGDLLRRADDALYRAKNGGRNRVISDADPVNPVRRVA